MHTDSRRYIRPMYFNILQMSICSDGITNKKPNLNQHNTVINHTHTAVKIHTFLNEKGLNPSLGMPLGIIMWSVTLFVCR